MDEKALYNTGIREGREEGEQRKKMEVIKKMLKENFDKNVIKKIANATDEEIEEAKKRRNRNKAA